MSFVHHSDQPVQELKVGTLLSHNDTTFGAGIFTTSQVLMTSFDRDTSDITGIIINKTFTNATKTVYIGGPVDMSQQMVLHNVPNVPGARQVIPGIYTDGDVKRYADNPQFFVRYYYGYASWFSGQLDGEIRNGDGWTINNDVTAEQVISPHPVIQMNGSNM